jgi:hypothetical protein
MIRRIVTCDRCGCVVEAEHPDRISVAKQHYDTYQDYTGKPHRKSFYKTDKTIHLCNTCSEAFELFLKEGSYVRNDI